VVVDIGGGVVVVVDVVVVDVVVVDVVVVDVVVVDVGFPASTTFR
jgi:hypothetical protein